MDFRERLHRNYQAIVDDLDVQHIHAELFQNNALTSGDFDNLFEMKTRDERTRYLLDTLINKGSISAYETFLDSLAKDYAWLRDKLIENNDAIMNDSFEDSLSKGDVPRLPYHYVKRTLIERTILEHLTKLKRHHILALHGMSGSGKTVAAISALRENSELILNNFQGVVMWLNMGNCKTEDDIIAQQTKLLRKATSMYTRQSYMNSSISMSSIGSNGDSQSFSTIDWKWDDLKDKLKTQFLEPTLKECLLVLDEVNHKLCLEAFDIGCKILITTRDTDVVSDYPSVIVKIENNFEKEETLELFASCLEEPVYKLPRQAKTLHEVCKGSPFHIALIGAQLAENKEKLKDNPRHWDYYVKKLEKKEFIFLTRPNYNPMKTIEMCINSLNPEILQLFRKLGILPDNVKISTKVLSKLWNKDTTEVSSIMKQLKSKSLIIETYDRDRRNYLYEVHDLIMSPLRKALTDNEARTLHDQLLTNYNYTKTDTPIEIPDDGYIAFYIGYHILNTNDYNYRWELFKTLYLDLKFLGNKVRLTGPADVMADLEKYENHIASNDLDRSLILSIRGYLSTHGTDLYHYQCTDIIQSILQYESTGILFAKASEIAQSNIVKNELYFDFLHEENVDGIRHSTIDVKDKITTMCFLVDYVLVGTNNGTIKFFHIPTNKLAKELCDGESPRVPVKWVGVSHARGPPLVTALYYDGVIRTWRLDDLEQEEEDDVIEEEPEESYNNNLPGNTIILPKHGHVITCRWSSNEDVLIAQTNKKIIMYRPSGEVAGEIDNFERDCELLCCMPCSNDRYLAVATTGSGKGVEVIDLKTKERFLSEESTDQMDIVLDIITVPGSNKIITLKDKEIMQYEFKIHSGSINKSCTWKIKTVLNSFDIKTDMCFLSIAVNKIGTLLFVSTDDCRVLCIDLKTNKYVFELDNRRGNVITMAVSEIFLWDELVPGSDVLLTGTDTMENSAKVWFLDSSYVAQTTQKTGKIRLTTKFDVSFLSTTSPTTPSTSTPNSGTESLSSTPKRHQSFANHRENKPLLRNTRSLDRHSLKPLNLKGICNNNENCPHPLLVVIDDKNNIQVMRGKKVLTEISENSEDPITHVKITPCNQHIIYGLKSGLIKRYTLRTKDVITIMDLYGPAQYINFVNSNLLMVAGKNRRIMAYKLSMDGVWNTVMMERGNTYLGSQEILNDIQGVKKKNGQADAVSNSESDASLESKDRMFPNSDTKSLCKGSGLIECFSIPEIGFITVEYNASIKLWDLDLKLKCVLNARQLDVMISSATLKKDVLVICDRTNMTFQTFNLKIEALIELSMIQEFQLNNEITCCDLTADGNILAMGLDSGHVVIWNVRTQRQISLLRQHSSRVQSASFSAVPARLYRSSAHYSSPFLPSNTDDDSQPPLVLVTMATEIVWWNITYDMKVRANGKMGRPGLKALTPLATTPIATTPLENKSLLAQNDNNANNASINHFFADGMLNQMCWKAIWKGKTYKQGSKRKEILACIKLSGVTAKRLCHDDQFSCFVTVDNSGHIHVMNVMHAQCT